ncbi:PTS system sorbose subfamily transporter subunit IIB [Streptococcus uberis]|nr:PTS system sorbose subfamily transporter subunit IIB [Streptococcus uberis]
MTVTFVRIDDRMIHGQTVTRWAKEYPCDGLIAVNDAAAANKVLTQAYKGASDKKHLFGLLMIFLKNHKKF